MTRNVLSALAGGMLLAAAGTGAQAVPAAPPSGTPGLIHQVAEGCGPGFFRGRRGFCRPMRGPGPGYGGGYGGGYGRGGYGPRCFVRPTPFGPRRVCR